MPILGHFHANFKLISDHSYTKSKPIQKKKYSKCCEDIIRSYICISFNSNLNRVFVQPSKNRFFRLCYAKLIINSTTKEERIMTEIAAMLRFHFRQLLIHSRKLFHGIHHKTFLMI